MTSITISIPEQHLLRLQELAARLKTTPEELAKAGVEEILSRVDEDFERVADYVLNKNAELYRRLA
jgi:predicted transcriptional regulator